jgi:hypothetical protein
MTQGEQMKHQVRDGARTLEFEGTLLAHSSSWRAGAQRWVEFFLYKTASGTYVLSRVGLSLLFHRTDCAIVRRNKLKLAEAAGLDEGSAPCEICSPERTGTICPERPRYWAQVYEEAQGVIEGCWKYDEHGAHYYTMVARRLLEEASKTDSDIESAYLIEYVN